MKITIRVKKDYRNRDYSLLVDEIEDKLDKMCSIEFQNASEIKLNIISGNESDVNTIQVFEWVEEVKSDPTA